jgi:hypothetical protein
MRVQLNMNSDDKTRDASTPNRTLDTALLAAALLLPLAAPQAHAESAPEKTTLSYKYLDYLDSQPDADRIGVKANALLVTTPINDEWSLTGGYVTDSISGASPRYHTRQLTQMRDFRRGATLGVTRYMPEGTLTVTGVHSAESDYVSRSLSATGIWFTDASKNTALTAGLGLTRDSINPNNKVVVDESKRVNDVMIGVTQVLGVADIAQLTLRHSRGTGYYTDPYKAFDERPRERNASTALARWNHHFESLDSTLRVAYRYYTDSFDIRAHTVDLQYAQSLPHGWTVTPLLRFYTQTAASFYVPVDPARGARPTFPASGAIFYSEDQRLSAFGAITTGLKIAKQLTPALAVDLKFEFYRQRANWAVSGKGDEGLAPFDARSLQLGFTYQF